MKRPSVLVTGATGFVGKALVRKLLNSGADVRELRLLVRDCERAARLGLPPGSLVAGSLEDAESLDRACRGIERAFHLAGAIKALSREGFQRVNARGTTRLVGALRRRAPGCRLVHVSSIAAAGPSTDGACSSLPPARCQPVSHYGESKRCGEQAVEALGDELSWVVLRPPIVYGPGDDATRLLFRQSFAWLAPIPWQSRPLSLIHVDDLVFALLLAGEANVRGCFLPLEGPDRLATDTLVPAIGAACGRRVRSLRIPLAAGWPVALLGDLWARLLGRPAIFSQDKLREIRAMGWVCDPQPAREALGFVGKIPTARGFRDVAVAEGWDLAGRVR